MPARFRLSTTALAACAVALALTGCNRGDSGAVPTPGPCMSPNPPFGPDVTTSLRREDAGKTLCLKVGQVFSIYLNAPVGEAAWARVDSSRDKVLTRRALNQVTLARGVTGALFVAAKPGATELSSVRSPCADPHASCDPATAWTAVVVVSR